MGDEPGGLVVMELARLEPGEVVLPRGFALRPYARGDEDTWVAIQSRADTLNTISHELFQASFGSDAGELERRQCYVCDAQGAAVATITAWMPAPGVDPAYGRLHWLAVVPPLQGRGIGSALVVWGINRLRLLGYRRAYLTTSAARAGALRLYERHGFRRVPAEALLASG